jgi:hypothetical protein
MTSLWHVFHKVACSQAVADVPVLDVLNHTPPLVCDIILGRQQLAVSCQQRVLMAAC